MGQSGLAMFAFLSGRFSAIRLLKYTRLHIPYYKYVIDNMATIQHRELPRMPRFFYVNATAVKAGYVALPLCFETLAG